MTMKMMTTSDLVAAEKRASRRRQREKLLADRADHAAEQRALFWKNAGMHVGFIKSVGFAYLRGVNRLYIRHVLTINEQGE